MPTESGYSNKKMYGTPQYKTIHDVGSSKFATNVITKGLIERTEDPLVIEAVSSVKVGTQIKNQPALKITITDHGAKRAGEVLRVYSGELENLELDIIQVIDADNFLIYDVMETIPLMGDEVKIAYYRTPQFDIAGNIVTSSGPVQFNLEGVPVEVSEDNTFPVNNKPLPSGMYIKKEGVNVAVADSATPADVVALPVKIMAVDGTNINITAGDINIQTTDMGANFDSMRVGDGSGNYIGVNPNQEALVHDAEVKTELETLNAVDFATEAKQDDAITALSDLLTELKLKADLTETQPISAAALPLPSGAATEATLAAAKAVLDLLNLKDFSTTAKQDDAKTVLDNILTALGVTNAKDFATQTTLAALEAKFGTLGQKASAGSAPVVLSVAQEAILASLDTKLSTLIASNAVRTLDSVVNVAATTANSPAPAGAKGFIIQNSANSNGGVRFTKQGGGASATVGFYLGVGQSTSYIDGAANLALFDVDATGFDAAIIWFT